MKDQKIAILLAEAYEDLEFWYPYYRLKEEGFDVISIAAEKNKQYPSKHGYPAVSDYSAHVDIEHSDLSGIIIPGGYAPDHMRRHESMVTLVRNMGQANKVVAAICHGGWMLASAGIVKNRRVTSFFAIRDDLVNAGAKWEDSEVVVDGNLITSRQPSDLPAFLKAILKRLKESP